MTTTESTAAPIAGIAPENPLRVAERLRDKFRVGAAERDQERKFPYEPCAEFRASGLLGLMVPREHGGNGGTFMELMKVVNRSRPATPTSARCTNCTPGDPADAGVRFARGTGQMAAAVRS